MHVLQTKSGRWFPFALGREDKTKTKTSKKTTTSKQTKTGREMLLSSFFFQLNPSFSSRARARMFFIPCVLPDSQRFANASTLQTSVGFGLETTRARKLTQFFLPAVFSPPLPVPPLLCPTVAAFLPASSTRRQGEAQLILLESWQGPKGHSHPSSSRNHSP